MVERRKYFTCSLCGAETSRTMPNYYRVLKSKGIVYCGTCASALSNKLQSAKLKERYSKMIKNTDIVDVACYICGKVRRVSYRALKENRPCQFCAAKKRYRDYADKYAASAKARIGNEQFGKVVSEGLLKLPAEKRSEIGSKNGKSAWGRPEHRAMEKIGRNTSEYRAAKRAVWDRPGFRDAYLIGKDEFAARCNIIHDNKYDYSKVVYVNCTTKVVIICPMHGEFLQSPSDHLYHRTGCPACQVSTSKWQTDINNYVIGLGFDTELNNRTVITPYEADIYIASKALAIECHGTYWHACDKYSPARKRLRHYDKATVAHLAGIKLLQFYEHEWNECKKIVQSVINHNLGLSHKIPARKCKIVELDNRAAFCFFLENHLQGGRFAQFNVGLEHDSQIVAAMSLSRHQRYGYELIRFASLCGYGVVGGFTKLLKAAMTCFGIKQIMTFADRRYSTAKSYLLNGFKLLEVTRPGYCYVLNDKAYNRRQFQKHKLHSKLLVFDPALSEMENMFANGYKCLWDAGQYKLLLS